MSDPDNPPTGDPVLFHTSHLAQFCAVDLKTIHNWCDRGKIEFFRTPGRHMRFRPLAVRDFLAAFGYPIPQQVLDACAQQPAA